MDVAALPLEAMSLLKGPSVRQGPQQISESEEESGELLRTEETVAKECE